MFGAYELLERLGKGGMAEVYLARKAGPLGISRFVALKRMLADLPSERGNSMFVDEMRLAVRLSHPNIVQVHDFGVEGEQYYLAMEFVEGRDVHQILKYASRKQPPAVDIESALYIIAAVARGLDHAHRLTGPDGRAAQIVHRDVSPANIMVTYTGDVKLADFGIARAAQHLRMTNTEAGEIKGKIRYMSPEQARGESVDYRTDLFALGIVLLELITLAPAFAAESDIASLLRVQEGVPKDWEFKRKVIPPDVLPIIETAMAVHRDNRYGSGELLASACELVLRKRNPGYGPAQLAAYMHSMFAREHADWRARLAAYEQQPPGSITTKDMNAVPDAPRTPSKPGAAVEIPRDMTAPVIEMGPATGTGSSHVVDDLLPPARPSSERAAVRPSGARDVVSPQAIARVTPARHPAVGAVGSSPLTPTGTGQLESTNTTTVRSKAPYVWIGGLAAGALVAGLGVMVFRHQHEAPPPVVVESPVTPKQPIAAPPPPTQPATPPAQAKGRLVLTTNAMATRVYLDASPTQKSPTPVAAGGMSFKVDIPSGTVWTLRVEADGFKTVTIPLIIGAGEETVMPMVMTPESAPPTRRSSGGSRPTAKKDDTPKPQRPATPDAPPAPPATNPNLVNPF